MSLEETRVEFAKILSTALKDQNIRDFIKEESLRKIDNDYDVIYHYVKNKELRNGITFQDALSQYCNTSHLNEITKNDLLLTIFVPSLGGSFSAESWDTESQTPEVVIRPLDKKSSLTVINKNEKKTIDRKIKPDFPVIVIKSNERLISSVKNGKIQSKSTINNYFFTENNNTIYFLDNSFDNTKPQTRVPYLGDEMDINRINAFFLNNESPRDYIYYGISPKKNMNKGTIDHKYREYLTSISFNNPGTFNHVSDSYDPNGDWTDGQLEIQLDFLFIDNQKTVFSFTKLINVNISDLYKFNNNKPTETLTYSLQNPIALFEWDLYKYGDLFKIIASEYDPGNEIESTHNVSSTFGTNFESSTESTSGDTKIGNKYSNSSIYVNQSTIKVKSTNNSDPLGDTIVNFFDPIYKSMSSIEIAFHDIENNYTDVFQYKLSEYESFKTDYEWTVNNPGKIKWYEASSRYKYDTGMLSIGIETRKVN